MVATRCLQGSCAALARNIQEKARAHMQWTMMDPSRQQSDNREGGACRLDEACMRATKMSTCRHAWHQERMRTHGGHTEHSGRRTEQRHVECVRHLCIVP